MPRPPKPPGRRQGHRSPPAHPRRAIGKIPAAPRDLLQSTRTHWDAFWRSDVAQATRDEHLPIILRYFTLLDERVRSYRTMRLKGRLVMGSQGQPILNPLVRYMAICDAEIRQLEDRLGLSPKAMALLGTHFAAAQRSLDELNDNTDETDEGEDENDPRVLPLRGEGGQEP